MKIFKKLLIAFVFIFFVFAIVGCQKGETEKTNQTEPSVPTETGDVNKTKEPTEPIVSSGNETPTPVESPTPVVTPTPVETPTPVAQDVLVTSIALGGSSKVEIGASIIITCVVSPADATNKDVVWSSSDESIATVNGGIVTGVSAGKATITATSTDGSNVKGELEVTVKEKPKAEPTDLFLTVNGTEYHSGDIIEVTEGDVVDLVFRYVPAENVLEGVDMSVSNEKYAYLNDDNQLVCIEPGSLALIVFAQYGDVEQTYVFKVNEKHYEVEEVNVTAPYTEFEESFECQLVASITPVKASQEVTWSSSDESVATVSSDGVVTAIKAGNVTITATSTDDNSKTGTIDLVIKEMVPFDRSKIYVNASYTNFGETVELDGVTLTVGKNAVSSIAEAMKVCSTGAKIYLAAGNYEGALDLDKEVQLIGPNKGTRGQDERVSEAVFDGLITITADGVVLDGLKMIDKASIRVGADNVTLRNLLMNTSPTKCNGNNRCACIVDYSPVNSGMGDGSEYINNLTVKNCKIVVPGTTWGYLANYMSFTKINNLYVTGNYISNEGTNPGTAGEGIMVYYMNGDCIFKNNVFEYATNEYLMKIAYFSTSSELVEITGNVFSGRGSLPTGTIGIIKNSQNTVVKVYNNVFKNVSGSGGTLSFETSNANAKVNVEFNLFDENTEFTISKTVNKLININNNCYLGGASSDTLYGGPNNDSVTFSTTEDLANAYALYLQENAEPVDTSVVYVDSEIDEEDETHFYTLAKAYEAVSEGGIIRVASGTYDEELTFSKAVTFIGPNESITATGDRRSEAVYLMHKDTAFINASISFIGMTIKGQGGASTTTGVYFQTGSSLNGTVEFTNCIISDMNTFIKFNSGSYELNITDCKFSNIGQFITWIMNGNNGVKFVGNYVDSETCGAVVNSAASLLRIRSGSASIINNTFNGNTIAGDGLFENGVSDNTFVVKYNVFQNVTTYIHNNGGNKIVFDNNLYIVNNEVVTSTPDEVKVAGVEADVTVYTSVDDLKEGYTESDHPAPSGVTIRVSTNYKETNDTHYKTIKDALDHASEGDVIYVYPGKYTDLLTINKNNISIIGYNYDLELEHTDKFTSDASLHTIISGKINISSSVTNLTLSGFVSGGQITISGVDTINISHVISVSPTYDWSLDGCIRINGATSDVTIDHFYISGSCPNRGIHINAAVTNFSITNSSVLDGTSTMYDFVRFSQSSNISTAFGTIIMKNCYVDGIQSGFMDRVPAGTTYIIEDNYFKNVRTGVTLLEVEGGKETAANITISGNTFDGCGDISNKWDVLQVLSGNETVINIHNNEFKNSFPNGESSSYYIINIYEDLGTIDCSHNKIDKSSQQEMVHNTTNLSWD